MTGFEGILTALAFGAAIGIAVSVCQRLLIRWLDGRRGPEPLGVPIGVRKEAPREPIALGLDELQEGVLVGGSPGAGKTTLLVSLCQRIPSGVGLVYVDLKGDRSLAGRLGIPSKWVFGLGDRASAAWSPLEGSDPGSWRDILVAAEEWTEPHYRRAAARYLGALLGALAEARPKVELGEVIELTEQPKQASRILRLLDGSAGATLDRARAAIEAEPSLRSGVLGLGNRLALLCESPASQGRFGAAGGIDLAAALSGERILFSLPAAEFPDEAPAIAACAIQSLGAAGQRLARGDELLRVVLIVDEAPRLGGQQLRETVAIGRGAGIGPIVAVQDFADLDYVAEGTREAVETGANTWIVMRQVASGEHIANLFGSKPTTREAVQYDRSRLLSSRTGMGTYRVASEYRVSPNVIRELPRGEAIVWRRLRARLEHVLIARPDGEAKPLSGRLSRAIDFLRRLRRR